MAEVAFAIFGGNGLQRVTRWARRQPAPADRDCMPRLKAEASRASQAKFPASAERTALAVADSSPAASGAQKNNSERPAPLICVLRPSLSHQTEYLGKRRLEWKNRRGRHRSERQMRRSGSGAGRVRRHADRPMARTCGNHARRGPYRPNAGRGGQHRGRRPACLRSVHHQGGIRLRLPDAESLRHGVDGPADRALSRRGRADDRNPERHDEGRDRESGRPRQNHRLRHCPRKSSRQGWSSATRRRKKAGWGLARSGRPWPGGFRKSRKS